MLERPRPHEVRLALESVGIVDLRPVLRLHRRLYTTLRLLYDVPGLVRQMVFLPRRKVDVPSLRVGQRVDLRRPRRVVVDGDVLHRDPGEGLDSGLEAGRKAAA